MRLAHRVASRIERAYENDNADSASNGEFRILHALRGELDVVFDVGANVGDWTLAALDTGARDVVAFEIEPTIREQLTERLGSRATIEPFGLADSVATVAVAVNGDHTSTVLRGAADHHIVECPVTTGDRYCAERSIERVDFVKIDVEGADLAVLRGFTRMLSAHAIRLVQFEFTAWAPRAGVFLRDFYDLLEPLGYEIGKVYPRSVEWRSYAVDHERFLRANFVATCDPAISAAVAH